MKKQIFAIIFAIGISLGVSASQVNAQSQAFRIDVPFEFTANNKTLPAGTYVVNSATDNRVMWSIQSAHQRPGTLLIAGSLSEVEEYGNVRLTFRRYGDRHFLIGFKTHSYQVKLPTSGSEKDFRRTWNGDAKNDLAIVEAYSGR